MNHRHRRKKFRHNFMGVDWDDVSIDKPEHESMLEKAECEETSDGLRMFNDHVLHSLRSDKRYIDKPDTDIAVSSVNDAIKTYGRWKRRFPSHILVRTELNLSEQRICNAKFLGAFNGKKIAVNPDMATLSIEEQERIIGEKIREHYRHENGKSELLGRITGYVWNANDQDCFEFSTDGFIIGRWIGKIPGLDILTEDMNNPSTKKK